MEDPLVTAVVVTGIGMLALFLALAVLYGLMLLMTAVLRDGPALAAHPVGPGAEPESDETILQAAAVAVALARAEQELGGIGPQERGQATGAWRALHHQRQLTRSRDLRRSR